MSIYVKDSGTWSFASNVYVNNGGTWIEPQEVYVNNSGTWTLLHKVVYISSNQTNLNLYSYAGSPSSSLRLLAIINSGVIINSASTASASLSITGFSAGSQVKLVNYGTIKGAGGNGGAGADYGGSAGAGGNGGTAVSVGSISGGNVVIENNGTFAGGGGGAGGGGYSSTSSTCFPAGTLVNTPNGLTAIETLNIGDLVFGFDIGEQADYSAELVAKPVTQIFKHSWLEADEHSKLLVITHSTGTLIITGNHEVLTSSRAATGPYEHFVRAEHLQAGDIIYDAKGFASTIEEINLGAEYDYAYNIEVADVHTYIANDIRVHNGGGGGGGKGTTFFYYAGLGGSAGTGDVAGTNGANGSAADGALNAAGVAGGLGLAGTAGSQTNAGAGGAAGYYITGNTNVTWTSTGTLLGSTT